MRARKTVLAGLIVVAVLGLSACGGGDDEPTADVRIPDDQLRYEPSELEIDLNQEQTFTFFNSDDRLHNVTIPAVFADDQQNAVNVDIPPGERVTVRVPAVTEVPRDGFFLFYCKFHQTEGMSGRLVVSS